MSLSLLLKSSLLRTVAADGNRSVVSTGINEDDGHAELDSLDGLVGQVLHPDVDLYLHHDCDSEGRLLCLLGTEVASVVRSSGAGLLGHKFPNVLDLITISSVTLGKGTTAYVLLSLRDGC